MTTTLTHDQAVDALWARVQEVQKGCKKRLLTKEDVEEFLRLFHVLYKEARAQGKNPDEIYLRCDGGAVIPSYGFAAFTTVLRFCERFEVSRNPAQVRGKLSQCGKRITGRIPGEKTRILS